MKISNNPMLSFTSRNNPVPDFKIKTQKGELTVKEFTIEDAKNRNDLLELTEFFVKGFMSNTEDPKYTQFNNEKNKQGYLYKLNAMADYYGDMFKVDDGNLTVLVAKDSKGELAGAVIANTLNEAGVHEKSTCYIDSIAVAQEYRKNKVGQILENKAIECSKDIYQDVFLASDNLAVGFQLKNGFRILDYTNPAEKRVIDKINLERCDYPDYITFMDKSISPSDTPWYERAFKDD